jgi:hypothetical protein
MTQPIVSITRGPDGRPLYRIDTMACAIHRPTEVIRLAQVPIPKDPPATEPTAKEPA